MRRFKTIMFAIFSTALVALFGFEVLAAVYLNITIHGDVEYYATEIGASIWGTYSYNPEGEPGTARYLALSGGGGSVTDDVYEVTGNETSYSNISANIGSTLFTGVSDTLTLLVFIKNTGDRYIIPTVNVTFTDTTHITSSTDNIFFDISAGNTDPLTLKQNAATASIFVEDITDEIDDGNYYVFNANSSIDNEDVYVARITISLQNVSGDGNLNINASFDVDISFMADVQYTSNDVLSVYQSQNITSTAWTKFGYNATLSATATKVEENNLNNLEHYLRDHDDNGNADITFGRDDYLDAIVYKDIDVVNVDIATGEIVGKLSDVNYDFEWYGRSITLPAGTTLASGRTLSTSETFTVDVYTYYPTMYIRRWTVGDKQWISVSDRAFAGAVEIPEYYTATFEATIFNEDLSVAHNSYGIITRSYIYDRAPLVNGSSSYLTTNYNYGSYTGYTANMTQYQAISWASNLTQAWQNSVLYHSAYTCATLAQSENYTAFVYNLLYLVKYANNNSQETIGYGNTYTFNLYNTSGTSVTSGNGATITTGGNNINSYMEAEKGGGTIGVYKYNQKGTATYDSTNGYKMSESGFDNAGMNYGYNNTYTYGTHKTGLYSTQFLTYNTGTKKYLLDGYVGSNKYTSVFCLGQANPWGNIWTGIGGIAITSDGTNLHTFVNFNDYDYEHQDLSWYMTSNSNGYEDNKPIFENRDYYEMGYIIPSIGGIYRYMGTTPTPSTPNGVDILIGLPITGSSTGNASTGLCDNFYISNSTTSILGLLRGGLVTETTSAGIFCFAAHYSITRTSYTIGFRVMLR